MPKSGVIITVVYGTVVTGLSLSNYISVTFIPLASFQSLKTTTNIALSVILFAIFVKEQIFPRNVLSAVICTVGVILIVQPEFLFTGTRVGSGDPAGEHFTTVHII